MLCEVLSKCGDNTRHSQLLGDVFVLIKCFAILTLKMFHREVRASPARRTPESLSTKNLPSFESLFVVEDSPRDRAVVLYPATDLEAIHGQPTINSFDEVSLPLRPMPSGLRFAAKWSRQRVGNICTFFFFWNHNEDVLVPSHDYLRVGLDQVSLVVQRRFEPTQETDILLSTSSRLHLQIVDDTMRSLRLTRVGSYVPFLPSSSAYLMATFSVPR